MDYYDIAFVKKFSDANGVRREKEMRIRIPLSYVCEMQKACFPDVTNFTIGRDNVTVDLTEEATSEEDTIEKVICNDGLDISMCCGAPTKAVFGNIRVCTKCGK